MHWGRAVIIIKGGYVAGSANETVSRGLKRFVSKTYVTYRLHRSLLMFVKCVCRERTQLTDLLGTFFFLFTYNIKQLIKFENSRVTLCTDGARRQKQNAFLQKDAIFLPFFFCSGVILPVPSQRHIMRYNNTLHALTFFIRRLLLWANFSICLASSSTASLLCFSTF